ncbi:MAG: EVE domain-containing protein [Acidimicrobiia bacterium]
MVRHWLVKTEPESFSIDDLKRLGRTSWDGVRNFQARNFMRDDMALGDWVLVYHSNAKPPGVVGLGEVVRTAYPDHTAWDPASKYFDEQSSPEDPRWFMVDVGYVETFPRLVSLDELRSHGGPGGALEGMPLVTKSRLSVQPVTLEQFEFVVALAGGKKRPRTRRKLPDGAPAPLPKVPGKRR